MKKVTFIATVFNEEETIDIFISSILSQTKKPDEIIIVDGGSKDRTFQILKTYPHVVSFVKKGNRSIGRNFAISRAKNDIIAISDAGCILDKNWLKNITKPFERKEVDVVAGYYRGKYDNDFQKALIPYVLVMEDNVDSDNFLPSSRSMAIRKTVWKKVGKFSIEYSHNEDYVFAKSLEKNHVDIVFAKNAIVYWIPRKNLGEAYTMFYRFAFGDSQAGIYRPKVILIFVRYFLALGLFLYGITVSHQYLYILLVSFLLYVFWAVIKNYKYVSSIQAVVLLPILQQTSDVAVIFGTLSGYLNKK